MNNRNANGAGRAESQNEDGFTLIEVLVAVAITLILMGSVFGLLTKGQDSFRREHQVADMQMSTRSGLQLVSRDLAMAGYRTPSSAAILWNDGGGIEPDELTIVYADPDVAAVPSTSMRDRRCRRRGRPLWHDRSVRDSLSRSGRSRPYHGDC